MLIEGTQRWTNKIFHLLFQFDFTYEHDIVVIIYPLICSYLLILLDMLFCAGQNGITKRWSMDDCVWQHGYWMVSVKSKYAIEHQSHQNPLHFQLSLILKNLGYRVNSVCM